MKLYYRVNDYYPFNIEGSSAASSVRHRVNRVCRCLPDDIELKIYSIVKSSKVSTLKRECYDISQSHQCVTYFVATNVLGGWLKGGISIWLMIYLTLKTLGKKNFSIIYNILPANILIHMLFSFLYPHLLSKTIFQVEEIYSVYDFNFLKRKLIKISEKSVFNRGLNFIIVNENIRKLIRKKEANTIVDYGYDSRKGKSIKINPSDNIVYTGRLDYVGGVEILLQALADLPVSIKDKVIITGSGGLKDKTISYAHEIGVHYKGFLSDIEYESLLSNAKVSINPLRSKCKFSQYSFPSKVLQYLEYGCVVISSGIAQPELEKFFADELLIYMDDDPLKLNHLIRAVDELEFDKSVIINKYQNFMEMKEKKLNTFFYKIFRGK
ncbi:glycosyltransferase [Salmonella enterica subsp. enterica]|nr:glycosyltransferase [Salmonella enterica]